MAGVVRLMLLTVDHPNYSLKCAGESAVVHRLSVHVHKVRTLRFEMLFDERPNQVMDRHGADARRSL